MRGAWIETGIYVERVERGQSRAPCGARGLKRIHLTTRHHLPWSRPVRGAWIETEEAKPDYDVPTVAPRAGRVD